MELAEEASPYGLDTYPEEFTDLQTRPNAELSGM